VDIDTITEFTPAPGATWRPGDAWLGGGTWLFSQPQPELRRLLDLSGFGWPSLVQRPDGLEIAATCTIAELSRWEPDAQPGARPWPAAVLVRQCCDALLASFKVWNAATVGGNICLSLPAGPMTSLAASLDGVATLWPRDGRAREVPVVEFVTGAGRNVLRPGELLRSVTLPASSMRGRTAFRQASLSPVGRSAAVVIGRRAGDPPARDSPGGDSPTGESLADGPAAGEAAVVVTVTAATTRPVQLRFGTPPSPEAAVAALDRAALSYHDDVHGAPAWRAAMTRRYVAEVVAELSSPEPRG
jgi:CO/xanthine dehydrogenase FAD-binding subunit